MKTFVTVLVLLPVLTGGFELDIAGFGLPEPPPRDLPGVVYEVAWDFVTPHAGCLGVTPVQDTLLWVSCQGCTLPADTNRIYVYDLRTRVLLDSFFEDNGTPSGYAGMTYDPASDLVYAGLPELAQTFHAIDASSHELAGSYTLTGPNPAPLVAGVTSDGDSLYFVHTRNSALYKASFEGTNCRRVAEMPIGDYWGVTINQTNGRAYITEAAGGNEVFTYRFPGWAQLDRTPIAEVDHNGGCEMALGDSLLLVLDQIGSQVLALRMIEIWGDVGMDAILSPVGEIPGVPVEPQGRIRNSGASVINEVTCHCWIDRLSGTDTTRVYDTLVIHQDPLDPGDTVSVSFVPPFEPEPHSYYLTTMFTVCDDDTNCTNDTLVSFFQGIAGHGTGTPFHSVPLVSVSHGVLMLGGTGRAEFVDITGRTVADLHPGENDIRHLAPGVYFLRSAGGGERRAVSKVVVQH